MESLKTLFELQQMADQLDIPILQHYFRTFKPSEDKNLKAAIKNFHARGDLESADYRSAYHQLCDWFYGWDVSNAATTAAAAGGASNLLAQDVSADPTEEFSLKRVAREINLNEAGEKVECERIMKTFETLFGLSKRMLKRIYLQIEDMTPRIGQGLATMSNKQDENEEREDELKKEDVWKHERNETDDADNNHAEDTAEEDISGSFDDIRQQRAVDGLVVKKGDANSGEDTRRNTIFEKPPSTDRDSPHSSRSSSPSSDIDRGIDEKPRNSIVKNSTSTNSGPSKGFEFSPASHPDTPQVRRGLLQDGPNAFDLKSSMQRDINLCYGAVNKSLDYLLVCASNIILVLSFAEVLEMKDIFQKYNALAHDLSIEFVSNSLKTVWDLLNRELSDMNLAELRDPSLLKQRLKQIIEMNITYLKGNRNPRHKFRILHKKFELIHALFTAVDIHLFPNFIAAHKDGVKCAQFSAFDSNLWLTGGYDCIIRIHDLRPANNHICLSQYVGHKSIVTDVHFTKDDTHIVSCSFDRTIKIWNSQSASCERTLVGHTDSVMSCDVTTDKRFICSGSTDNTVRLWDFNTGACNAVIKKHTRWVKIVRFSPDGRFIASAGLDHKIYIWDVKFVANSRTFLPKRCLEDHRDYILDLAMARPSYLLTTSRDNTVRMFDYNVGCEIYNINLSPSWACTVSFAASGEYFATGSFDNNVVIYNSKDGTILRRIRVLNLGIMCVRFPKDLSYLVVGTQEGFLQQIPL